jgi:hypothetical protein
METKICSKCKIKKELSEFYKNKKKKDGLCGYCKSCWSIFHKEYRVKNSEKEKDRHSKYRLENKEKIKKWRDDNKEKINHQKRIYRKKKFIEDPVSKIRKNVRTRIFLYFRIKKITKKNKTFSIVGCTPQELKEHIEKQFKDGMTWDNWGLMGWHIDHIIPLASAKTEKDLLDLCHYTNLQPLWAEENWEKNDKII